MFAVPQEVKIISVTKLNRFAKQVLESEIGQVWVSGEISNFTRAASGHWYFTLKDDKAQVRTCMFKGANQGLGFIPKHGDKVVVRANISLYEARGDFQLIAVHMEPEGLGQLKQAFEALKNKLMQAGYFAQEGKKSLPSKITKIGIVTSPTGAAVHDILHVLQRRNPAIEVIIYPSMVQGDGAAKTIVEQINTANRRNEVDILIVGRGGGSLEDLWSFNEEAVAMAIYESILPVVSAVGHEVDVTIADFVADVRAATPSAAAELLSEDKQELENALNRAKHMLMRAWNNSLAQRANILENSQARLNIQHPAKKVQQHSQSLDYLYERLLNQHPSKRIKVQNEAIGYLQKRLFAQHPQMRIAQLQKELSSQQARMQDSLKQSLKQATERQAQREKSLAMLSPARHIAQSLEKVSDKEQSIKRWFQQTLHNKSSELARMSGLLETVSPLATLARGYSITFKENQVLRSTDQAKKGDKLITKVGDGEVYSTVEGSEKKLGGA
jgi:exodeoxyribonuclease VII large subunit